MKPLLQAASSPIKRNTAVINIAQQLAINNKSLCKELNYDQTRPLA
jgi:hypothetical protein